MRRPTWFDSTWFEWFGDFGAQALELLSLRNTWLGLGYLIVIILALWMGFPPLIPFVMNEVIKTDLPLFLHAVCKSGAFVLGLIAWSLLLAAHGMRDARNRGLFFWIFAVVGMAVAFFAADFSLPLLLILLVLSILSLAAPFVLKDNRKENAEYDLPRFAMFAMFFLGAWLMLTMPLSARITAAGSDRPTVQQAGVLPTLTPQPTLAPKPTTVPTTVPTKAAASTPTKVVMLCPPGLIPSTAKDKPTWLENPLGSNRFVEFKDLPLVGSEKLDGTFKEIAGQLFCQTDRKNANYPLWWKVK